MVEKCLNYLMNVGQNVPARSKATLLNEIAMALIECIRIYGKKINKLGKISKISICFWPVRLIPLNETRACVCSYLLNEQEKLSVGQFNQIPPSPDNVIKGADPNSFLNSLESYNATYLKKIRNYKRGIVIQEALFNTNEIGYFKNFFLNQYNLSSFSEPYFILEGEPIAKSVSQIKITREIIDFVSLKAVNMLDNYGDQITKICERWIQKGGQEADKIRGKPVDTREEEKQLAMLNNELKKEKERDIKTTPEELIKSGKFKISDKTGEFHNYINALNNSVEKLKSAISQKDLFLLDEGMKDLDLRYRDLGNSISRYKNEIAQLKKNMNREISDTEKTHQQKIRDLERKISEVQKQIDSKHSEISSEATSAEDIVAQIKREKQSCLDNIETIKDMELTNVQRFFSDYTIEIKTKNIVVGIPMFIFYFVSPNTNKTTERAPVFPILIEKGKIIRTKTTESFRKKIRDLMNKYTPMINLVENEGEKSNLMEMKNLDTKIEEALNDLRIQKIINKKQAASAKEVVNNLIW